MIMYYKKELTSETLQALNQTIAQKNLTAYCKKNGLTPSGEFEKATALHIRVYLDKSNFRSSFNCFAVTATEKDNEKYLVISEMFQGKIAQFHFDNFFETLEDGQKVSKGELKEREDSNEYSLLRDSFSINDVTVYKNIAPDGSIYYAPKVEKKK